MIIAIDGNEANITSRVGVNQFAFEVLWGLNKLVGERAEMVDNDCRFIVFLQNIPLGDMPPESDYWRYEIFGPKQFWTWTGLVKRLYFGKPKPQLIFSPSHYGPGVSPVPSVISIMDLGFLRYSDQFIKKDYYQLKYWTHWSAKKAKKIIAISNFTKKDIIETYGIAPKKIVVAYPGWQKTKDEKKNGNEAKNRTIKVLRSKYRISGEYIFYLGTIKPSKNIEGLVDALGLARRSNPKSLKDLKLVISGKKGWLYETLFLKVRELGLQNNVVFTGYVSDEEAKTLMEGAEAFVMPSFWEGFGIPILEAMALGTPVICSNVGSLPEVAAKAAIFVNPHDISDISQAIVRVVTDKTMRNNLTKSGKERVRMFSWEKCSKIILNTLLDLARQNQDNL